MYTSQGYASIFHFWEKGCICFNLSVILKINSPIKIDSNPQAQVLFGVKYIRGGEEIKTEKKRVK